MKYDISTLTLEEKLRLLTGKNTWQLENANGKLPTVFLSDGPHGLRMINLEDGSTKKATAMPNLCVVASTWDKDLAYLDGATIADDCLENGADVLLAPGVNIKRTPLCGRNFEYFSEDPLLAGVLGKAFIEGVQSKGVGTSLKHYCVNNREYDRLYQSSEIDERTLREIYLPAFEKALEAKPWTVMCAYNPINGVYASEHKKLMLDVLRGEFGFDGLLMSDWHAVHQSARAAKAGIDLEMPYRPEAYGELLAAYESGFLTMEEIDARVQNALNLMEKAVTAKKAVTTTKTERHDNAVKIAREGMVLLKNEGNLLPLREGNILVAGDLAKNPGMGGGGSSRVQSAYEQKPLAEELAARLPEGCSVRHTESTLFNHLYRVKNAKTLYRDAYDADTVVLCVGTLCVGNDRSVEGEGFDRTTLRLTPTQEDIILNTAKVNKNVVVVLYAGSAVDMSPWIDKVSAVVLAGFAGEGCQEAVADVLTGKCSPSGKLAETYPLCLEDTPTGSYRGDGFVDRYTEGVLVGYRWYDTKGLDVLFPFGHGLSYAEFAYSDLQIVKHGETDYEVSYVVTNTSEVDAKEVSQLYVRDVFAMVERPEKELRGFEKTALKAGESRRVSHRLTYRDFAYYSTALDKWHVENGSFEILVGASSRDIRLKGRIDINLPLEEQYSFN